MNIEFISIIRKTIKNKKYKTLKNIKHHINNNTHDHCIKVAYLCYRHSIKHNRNIDTYSLVRGALLHDYFLYDWRKTKNKLHCFTHPKKAYINAIQDYDNINEIEKDIILRHMFPLTPIPPKTKEGWIVCLYDKIATITDLFNK